jgi:prepilin-type N-terminal cleavage/methylation domain-containing protein
VFKTVRQLCQKLYPDSRGFTLVEVAVSLSILSMGLVLVGSATFQTLSIQRYWQDDAKAIKDARHAASWFSQDVLTATVTSLEDGGAPDDTVTLTTNSGVITYSLSGGNLVRQADASQLVVAENVVEVWFALAQQTLTFTLEVSASRGGTEILTLHNYLRLLD